MPLYFVRHGESHANEQNRFAGHLESPLTRLGIRQAHQAARRVASLGLDFDEVHVSTLARARSTAASILDHLDRAELDVIESPQLVERDFGVFSGRNKSLVKKSIGFREYSAYFHSSTGMPPGGESWHAMFRRVQRYHSEVLEPASRAGKNILVVSHKYVVEMFALVVAGAAPEGYRDLKIPNGRPLSESDLRAAVSRPSSHGVINDIGEVVEIRLPLFIGIAALLGFAAQLLAHVRVPHPLFLAVTALLLAISGFFGTLRLDPAILRGTTASVLASLPLLVLRLAAAVVLIGIVATPVSTLVGLFLVLPPALIAPTLSLSWGGDYFSASRLTVVGSLVLPALFFVAVLFVPGREAVAARIGAEELSALIVVVVGLLLPMVAAQVVRHRAPVLAGQLSTNWHWLGGTALIPLAFCATFAMTPSDPSTLVDLPVTLAIMCAVAIGIRLVVSAYVRFVRLGHGVARDIVITQTTPNVFLWIAPLADLGYGSSSLGAGACLVFFGGILGHEVVFLWRRRRELHADIRAHSEAGSPSERHQREGRVTRAGRRPRR
ncbi:MAG: Fructose-2,6-bisphosphatase [Microbacteriaceae bacterium]|nr:Fructose-2,6-bisphosphatase [Microbacteriaceae bacterium]